MGTKVNMFDYCKLILEKLSFSKLLFRKEYRKSFKYLNREERSKFRKWVKERFGSMLLSSKTPNSG
jgi:exonuclease I